MPINYLRCGEYDHQVQASKWAVDGLGSTADYHQSDCGPYRGTHITFEEYMDLVYDEFTHRRVSLCSGENPSHNLHEFRPLWDFSNLLKEIQSSVAIQRISYQRDKHQPSLATRHHKERIEKYNTWVSRYPTGGILDASLALAVPFTFPELFLSGSLSSATSTAEFVRSISFFDRGEGASLCLSGRCPAYTPRNPARQRIMLGTGSSPARCESPTSRDRTGSRDRS